MVTPNSTPRVTPVRSQSVEFTPKSINENDSDIKEEKVISEEPSTAYANLKKVTKTEIKTEPQSPPPPPSIPTPSVVSEEVSNNTFEQPLKVEIKEENVEHPVLGQMIADLGYKRLHLASSKNLATIPVWKKQRIYRHER